jgi:Holliday junction resolvasome RuvABC endonuclease subunit
MILGLDVSTSITGATILNEKGEVVFCESWDTRNANKFKDLFEKADFIRLQIFALSHKFQIKEVYIEQSLQSFRSGFSSAQTLSTLSRFNGIVSWICFKSLGIKPEYISAPSARKACEIKVPRGSKAKEEVLKHVLDILPGFVVEYTKHGNPRPGAFDRADSWVIAKAGFLKWKEKKLKS